MQQEPFQPRLDAHLHLQTIPWDSCSSDLPGREVIKSFLGKGSRSICNGTSPLDWNRVAAITERYPEDETAGEDLYDRETKRRVLGSLPTLPGIFGLILANMAYKKLIE